MQFREHPQIFNYSRPDADEIKNKPATEINWKKINRERASATSSDSHCCESAAINLKRDPARIDAHTKQNRLRRGHEPLHGDEKNMIDINTLD